MKPIKEVYSPHEYLFDYGGGAYFSAPYDYDPLLESFGYEILLKIDDDDYQGDSRLLFKDGKQYGLLIFGWGSCSAGDRAPAAMRFKLVNVMMR
jgi:hypothetical protein